MPGVPGVKDWARSLTEPAAESIRMPTMSEPRQRFNTLRIHTSIKEDHSSEDVRVTG